MRLLCADIKPRSPRTDQSRTSYSSPQIFRQRGLNETPFKLPTRHVDIRETPISIPTSSSLFPLCFCHSHGATGYQTLIPVVITRRKGSRGSLEISTRLDCERRWSTFSEIAFIFTISWGGEGLIRVAFLLSWDELYSLWYSGMWVNWICALREQFCIVEGNTMWITNTMWIMVGHI